MKKTLKRNNKSMRNKRKFEKISTIAKKTYKKKGGKKKTRKSISKRKNLTRKKKMSGGGDFIDEEFWKENPDFSDVEIVASQIEKYTENSDRKRALKFSIEYKAKYEVVKLLLESVDFSHPNLEVGNTVVANWKGKNTIGIGNKFFFPGKIAKKNDDGTYAIDYNDGDKETNVTANNIKIKKCDSYWSQSRATGSQVLKDLYTEKNDTCEACPPHIWYLSELLYSALENHNDPLVINLLLDKEPAILNLKDEDGYSPLEIAIKGNSGEKANARIVSILLEKGAIMGRHKYPNSFKGARVHNLMTPLHLAIYEQAGPEVIYLLLLYGAQVLSQKAGDLWNGGDGENNSPLHYAVMSKDSLQQMKRGEGTEEELTQIWGEMADELSDNEKLRIVALILDQGSRQRDIDFFAEQVSEEDAVFRKFEDYAELKKSEGYPEALQITSKGEEWAEKQVDDERRDYTYRCNRKDFPDDDEWNKCKFPPTGDPTKSKQRDGKSEQLYPAKIQGFTTRPSELAVPNHKPIVTYPPMRVAGRIITARSRKDDDGKGTARKRHTEPYEAGNLVGQFEGPCGSTYYTVAFDRKGERLGLNEPEEFSKTAKDIFSWSARQKTLNHKYKDQIYHKNDQEKTSLDFLKDYGKSSELASFLNKIVSILNSQEEGEEEGKEDKTKEIEEVLKTILHNFYVEREREQQMRISETFPVSDAGIDTDENKLTLDRKQITLAEAPLKKLEEQKKEIETGKQALEDTYKERTQPEDADSNIDNLEKLLEKERKKSYAMRSASKIKKLTNEIGFLKEVQEQEKKLKDIQLQIDNATNILNEKKQQKEIDEEERRKFDKILERIRKDVILSAPTPDSTV